MNEKWNYFLAGLIGATIIYVFIILSIVFVDVIKEKKEEAIVIKKAGTFTCDTFNNVRNTFDSNIVINDGKLYGISLDLKFSNEQNCMEISDKNIVRVINNYYIDAENNVYVIDDSGMKSYNANGKIPTYMMNEDVVMAHSYGASTDYTYYVLKTDGKLYDVKFNREFRFESGVGTYKYSVVSEEVYKEFEDEVIASFDVVDDEINFVVTNKGVYTNKISNMECQEYADIKCVYELTKNETLTTSMEEISHINHYGDSIKYVSGNTIYSFGV